MAVASFFVEDIHELQLSSLKLITLVRPIYILKNYEHTICI